MDTYSHITPFERGCIMALHELGYSLAAIATLLKRHRSTILRELNRNRSPDGTYSAQEAQARARIGDWEADTVAGVVGGAVLLTLVDRKSCYLHCVRLEKKTADNVNAGIFKVLAGQIVHSITPDRGKEFARHAVVAEALGIKIYIPPPYQPWQRGTNENTNGLLREYSHPPKVSDKARRRRQYAVVRRGDATPYEAFGGWLYLQKHQDIAQYQDEYIEKAVLALNNRPRKCLQWRTPYEVYFNEVLHLV